MQDEVRVRDQVAGGGAFAGVVAELRQWHVFRFAATFAVVAWLLVQVVATVGPAFDLPAWVLRAVVLASIVGFLAAMSFLLFRSRRPETGKAPVYLSRRARLSAGIGVLLVAAVAGVLSIRDLTAPEEVSLAVLPFADLSPGRDKAYFAEGVAEEILSALASEQGFKVLGRTSARELDRNPDLAAIRQTLQVTHLLEGSARTSGDQLRVNVRLIDTDTGSRVWEEEYDGRLADIFKFQDKIANAVVRRLRGSLISRNATDSGQASVDSYQTYLAARALMRDRSKQPLEQAFVLARRLVAADPDYAPGQALLAELYFLLSDAGTAYGEMPVDQARRLALPHARSAIRQAPDKADGYAALGLISLPRQAIAPLQRAIALDRARAELRIWLGIALSSLGRNDESFAQSRVAADIEPLWPVAINRLIQALAASGRYEEAAEAIRSYRRRGGAEAQALRFTGFVARAQGDISGAIAAERAALRLDPRLPYVAGWLVSEYSFLGLANQALGIEQGRGAGQFRRMWVLGDRAGLVRLARSNSASIARAPDASVALFALGAERDWRTIGEFLRDKDATLIEFCASQFPLVPQVIIALHKTGQIEKSRGLLSCMRERVELAQKMTMRAPDDDPGRLEMGKATLLALSGDSKAIDWLDKAVKRGWSGQYYSARLSDWPQFDALLDNPRMAALQRIIDARIARERREALRDTQNSARWPAGVRSNSSRGT